MKVLITRLQSTGNSIGGAEQSAWLHAKVLNELGHEVQLYSNASYTRSQVFHKVHMPGNKLLRFKWSFLYFPFRALVGRYDLLNPHSREDQIALTLTKWLHRTPVVWKDPGDLVHQIWLVRPNLLGKLNQKLLIAALKRADAIYMLNAEDRAIVLNRLQQLRISVDEDKLHVIPSDILFDDYNLDTKPPKSTQKLVVGTISRLDDHKGIQYLLTAAKELAKRHGNLEFWVVGNGPHRHELEKLAAANRLDVTFWGHQDDISPFLAGIDIFVQPAEFEGWGRNVKEAMYFGKPVVGSDVGGIAEQIDDGKTGLLFEPTNVDELAQKLELLIKDKPLRTKLGQAAHAQALASGDYPDLVKNQILPLFSSILKNKT